MNFQKFTLKSQEAIQTAQESARGYSNQQSEPVHILAAMLQDASGIVAPLRMKIGANVNYLNVKGNEAMESLPKMSGGALSNLYLWQNTTRMMESALKEAQGMGDEYVSTEHILLAMSEETATPAGSLLRDQGATTKAIQLALRELRGS